ncbi:phenylalanine--tRNA ligase subunit alpha [Candidatus Marinamargulisbacteria bacterium SCGC AG-343-D04]|nr:phenylalanine--tRNA ligase subunit alpha [Candidatus Marinamargulisbacteria bacterium SCGC AG-343-D04]
MLESLEKIKNESINDIQSAQSTADCDQLKSFFLGKKSPLAAVLKDIPSLPVEQRSVVGKRANEIKQELSAYIQEKKQTLHTQQLEHSLSHDSTDTSLPPFKIRNGAFHPITSITRDICDIFSRLGYSVKQGPNVESDFYNFEALNIPEHHPARAMHDTFYLKNKQVLRTHTSPVQIREMLSKKPPVKIIAPGKVYRCDADVSHSPVFHQIEGLCVDKGLTFSDLKGTLEFFLHELLGPEKNIRFRSSYFPFTEPSVEIDVEFKSKNKSSWMEIMGAGMVQRKVFKHVNYNADDFTGFAFGLGIERIAMIKYQIDDIRLFYENDSRFIQQF